MNIVRILFLIFMDVFCFLFIFIIVVVICSDIADMKKYVMESTILSREHYRSQ